MSRVSRRLSQIYQTAEVIPFNSSSKFVIMSDSHRGQGNNSDNFLKNQNLFFGALEHYYNNGFSYIELGDGDELWENRSPQQIIDTHSATFWLMSQFYKEKRFYMIYGNHDVVKRKKSYMKKHYYEYYCDSKKTWLPLFPNIETHEGIVLKNEDSERQIFLVHGHQGSLLNDNFWRVARFLVRYVWAPLETVGFIAPTGAGRPHEDKDKIEKELSRYAKDQNHILVAGHTHRPMFPKPQEGLYFNDGSGVHPRCITAIEIENNQIKLVKWLVSTRKDMSLFVDRQILAGPENIDYYYK